MGMVQEGDVGQLMQDQEFMDQVIQGLVEDSTTMDKLAAEIADKMEDALEDDPELRRRLVSAAVADEAFRQKLITKLVDELG